MKDLPHHMKKINRRVIRSTLRESNEEATMSPVLPPFHASKEEARKMAKRNMRAETIERTPTHDTEDERNRKMKHRVPVFDRNNAKPRTARASKKKTPKI